MTKLPHQEMVEQKITQQVTITAGNKGSVSIDIPQGKTVFLKGYGYSWFTSNKYSLTTGNTQFPTRSDQEGSPSIPVIFGTPFKARSGGQIKLSIENGDASSHTYDVVFYIITDELLNIESTGGDLNFTIGGATGTSSSVSIADSTGSTFADVITREDGRKALVVDTELELHTDNVTLSNVFVASTDGTVANAGYLLMDASNQLVVTATDLDIRALTSADVVTAEVGSSRTATHSAVTVGSTDTSALASNTDRKSALFINDSDETIYLSIGGTAVANTGIRLNANGGSYEMSKEQGNLSTAQIKCICASGSKTLLITEFE